MVTTRYRGGNCLCDLPGSPREEGGAPHGGRSLVSTLRRETVAAPPTPLEPQSILSLEQLGSPPPLHI